MCFYLQYFNNEVFAGVSRAQVQDVFEKYLSPQTLNEWRPSYDNQYNSMVSFYLLEENPGLLHGMSINTGDDQLFNLLYALLQLDNGVLYFGGCKAPIVADLVVAKHLPQSMIDALGIPVKVCSGAEIEQILKEA